MADNAARELTDRAAKDLVDISAQELTDAVYDADQSHDLRSALTNR